MTTLTDELLKQISMSGRSYPHEGRAMALEIMEWRKRAKEAAAKTTQQSAAQNAPGMPYPLGTYP